MKITSITELLETVAPLHLQEDYDNCGLLTGSPDWYCSGVLCTLDITESVVFEAIKKNCNLIVAHHPVIFRGLKQVSDTDPVGKTVIAAIRNDIAIYAAHTNFDNILTGVNSRIADKLALTSRKVLDPKPLANTGSGLIGDITPVSETAFFELLASGFNQSLVRHTPLTGKMISKVAVCGGSGGFLAANALNAGADVFVTADLKYHDFFGPDGRMLLCDIGHYESEQFTTDLFIEIILQKFPTFAVLKSEIKTNPVNYFTGKK